MQTYKENETNTRSFSRQMIKNKFDFVEKGKSFAQAGHSSAASQAQRSSGLRASVCSILKDNFFYFREAIERAYPKN
jgi:hypothetical protein